MLNKVIQQSYPLNGAKDLDPILKAIGRETKVVMIGEASHGTHEFYAIRAELTKRLINELGFTIVACESDWPDAYRVNRYVKGNSKDRNAEEALGDYERFPRWMWRNDVVLHFVEWLRRRNLKVDAKDKAGFYGLDLYSLQTSREEVIKYLNKVHPEMAKKAEEMYSCFDRFGENAMSYAYNVGLGMSDSCQREVAIVLQDILRMKNNVMSDIRDAEDYFYGLQNAKIMKNAEKYYRNMMVADEKTWNIRDTHMKETLVDLINFKENLHKTEVKAVIWAHNSHLGDARYTEMGKKRGEINIGQLAREHYGWDKTFNIGFTTYQGTVTAADNWNAPPKYKRVRKGMEGSYELLFHEAWELRKHYEDYRSGRYSLIFKSNTFDKSMVAKDIINFLNEPRLERAIGVIYRPATERWSHYFYAEIANQFDCVMHVDTSRALHPLEKTPQWEAACKELMPDTYPFAV